MGLPVNLLYWLLATLPILLLLVLMVWFHLGASKAAPMALVLAGFIAFMFFKANIILIGVEILKALWGSLSIILVIVTAILLYEVSFEAKTFSVLNETFEILAPNELLRIVGIGVVFASFLQGVTGFGVPVLVTAPLLIGIGVSPVWAVVIPLIGHSWAGTFGTLALAWFSLISQAEITDASTINSIAIYATFLLMILNLFASIAISYFYGGLQGIKKGFLGIFLISMTQGIGQIIFSQINAELAVFVPSSLSLIVLIGLAKIPLYKDKWQIDNSKIMLRKEAKEKDIATVSITAHDAFMPYYLMTAITLGVLMISPLNRFLSSFSFGPSFIETRTGFGVVNPQVSQFSPLKPFTHASLFLFIAFILGYLYYLKKGLVKSGSYKGILQRTIKKTIPSSLAIISLITLSRIMSGTGQTQVLAQGVSNVVGKYYTIISPFIGLLGSFITGSNMSSNILFADFQLTTSTIIGLNSNAILGAQTAGAAIGTSIAPGNIVLGTTTAGILGSEGEVLRKNIPFSLAVAFLYGLIFFLFI